jgi:hypothetical protein
MSKKTAATAKVNPGGVMKTATTTKTTTKPKMSAKQYAQYLRYVRRHPAKTAKAKKARKLAAPCSGGWVAGGNDVAETCAMAAIANSLGLDLDEGSHAALVTSGGLMVSWGGLIPARGVVEEAWALDWGLTC